MGELWAGRFQVSERRSSLTEPIRNQNDPKLPQEVASISSLGVCATGSWTTALPGRTWRGFLSSWEGTQDKRHMHASSSTIRPDSLKNQASYCSPGKFNTLNRGWAGGGQSQRATVGSGAHRWLCCLGPGGLQLPTAPCSPLPPLLFEVIWQPGCP